MTKLTTQDRVNIQNSIKALTETLEADNTRINLEILAERAERFKTAMSILIRANVIDTQIEQIRELMEKGTLELDNIELEQFKGMERKQQALGLLDYWMTRTYCFMDPRIDNQEYSNIAEYSHTLCVLSTVARMLDN